MVAAGALTSRVTVHTALPPLQHEPRCFAGPVTGSLIVLEFLMPEKSAWAIAQLGVIFRFRVCAWIDSWTQWRAVVHTDVGAIPDSSCPR